MKWNCSSIFGRSTNSGKMSQGQSKINAYLGLKMQNNTQKISFFHPDGISALFSKSLRIRVGMKKNGPKKKFAIKKTKKMISEMYISGSFSMFSLNFNTKVLL